MRTSAKPDTKVTLQRSARQQEWLARASMAIGLCVLVIFVGLALLAGIVPSFVCRSFVLLAAIFAFGAALAAGFIGGTAAAHGKLGDKAIQQSFQYSVGGGVAFFVIAFLIFMAFKPSLQDCQFSFKEMGLKCLKVPLEIDFEPTDRFWKKKRFPHHILEH